MDQLPTLQQLEYMETGFEVSKNLAQAGFSLDQPAFSITWGQIAEEIANRLDCSLSTVERSLRLIRRIRANEMTE